MLGRSINLQSFFYAYNYGQLFIVLIIAILIGIFARRLERAILLSLLLGMLFSNLTVLALFMFTKINQRMGDIFAIFTLAPLLCVFFSLVAHSIASMVRGRKSN